MQSWSKFVQQKSSCSVFNGSDSGSYFPNGPIFFSPFVFGVLQFIGSILQHVCGGPASRTACPTASAVAIGTNLNRCTP